MSVPLTILVTGASGGALCRRLAADGYHVAAVIRDAAISPARPAVSGADRRCHGVVTLRTGGKNHRPGHSR